MQTLADFSRPMELHLREHDLRQVIGVVMELTAVEMEENGVNVSVEAPHEALMVRADAELMQQAVLNLLLNGMQAMPGGGGLRVTMRREQQFAVVEVDRRRRGYTGAPITAYLRVVLHDKGEGQRNWPGHDI